MTTRTITPKRTLDLDRPATALVVGLLATGLTIAAIAGIAPDGGQDLQSTGATATHEDWRGNSASITPIR